MNTIPEKVKSEIIKRRNLGATWTAIAKWLYDEHAVEVHRTTIQRWYDSVVLEELDEDSPPEDNLDTRVKLDKKVATYKAEAAFFKKLYEKSIKDEAKKEELRKDPHVIRNAMADRLADRWRKQEKLKQDL